MILFCDFTNMTVLSIPAPERLNDDHIPGINHVDGKPSLDIVLFWVQRPYSFCQVGFESLARIQDRSLPWHDWLIDQCSIVQVRGLFTTSGGKALSAAHYQTTYALRHFLFICFTQQGIAKTKPFLYFHLFNLFLSCSLIILVGEGSLNSHIAKVFTT